jgi:thiamine pyrophosphate-dependent acetolactate synthase large subunit-like protein
MEGLRRHSDRVRFFLVHHEEAAAFMATAYAEATGKLGVCLATSGPGAIHLLNGLYDAKLDHAPVLAITGMPETSVLGTGYQQEVHIDRLYAEVAEYNLVVDNPAQLPGVVDIAIRTALARRGVAHLTFPNNVQVADANADPFQHVAPARPSATAPIWLPPPGQARMRDLEAAAQVLNGGEKVAILAFACTCLVAEVLAPEPFGRVWVANHFPDYQLDHERERCLQAAAAARRLESLALASPGHVIVAGDTDADEASTACGSGPGAMSSGT